MRCRSRSPGTSGSISHTAVTTLLVNIPPPLGLTATAGNAQVSLSWPASLGASSYTVQRALVSGGPYVTVGCPATTSYTDTGLTNGTTYYYVVAGAYTGDPNAGGGSADSPEASATPQQVPLTSIAVTPANPTVTVGGTQQFTATGKYSDGSTQNLTSQVTWASSNTADGDDQSGGPGHRGGRRDHDHLGDARGGERQHGTHRRAGPLTITTTALPAATSGVAYSATLAATGGTPPYTWSLASGTLPAGTGPLTAAGVISGTPTATGTSSFTVKVTAGAQSVTKTLSITVDSVGRDDLAVQSDARHRRRRRYEPGDAGREVPVRCGWRHHGSALLQGRYQHRLARRDPVVEHGPEPRDGGLHGRDELGLAAGELREPRGHPGQHGLRRILLRAQWPLQRQPQLLRDPGLDTPPLHALATGVAGGNGVYGYGGAGTFPASTFQALNYWVDVVFSAQPAPTLTSIAVTPANATLAGGATQQYTATGTYSDSSTQNLTSQVTWASSNTAAATINSTGLATGVSAGTTNILATLGSVSGSTGLTVTPGRSRITTTALPVATVGAAYTATLAATGGTQPYMWSWRVGRCPQG